MTRQEFEIQISTELRARKSMFTIDNGLFEIMLGSSTIWLQYELEDTVTIGDCVQIWTTIDDNADEHLNNQLIDCDDVNAFTAEVINALEEQFDISIELTKALAKIKNQFTIVSTLAAQNNISLQMLSSMLDESFDEIDV
jgi:acyl carrier protein